MAYCVSTKGPQPKENSVYSHRGQNKACKTLDLKR